MADNEKLKLLRRVQAVRFALHDAALYLDSHPACQEGLKYFREKRELCESGFFL